MRRGEIWTSSGGPDYLGKPRPVVILQDDRFGTTESITVCALTTRLRETPLLRLSVEPSLRNGLLEPSHLMVDKIATTLRSKLGTQIGRLDDQDMVRLNQAVLVFLGLAGPVKAERAP